MTINVVNLDAMIPRADFTAESQGQNFSSINRLSITDLEQGFLIPTLKKPDFQRETKDWSPTKVYDLIRTFVDGELIPAIILWQTGGNVFVIDGAHRLSALLAWVRNDYGDGESTKKFTGIFLPDEQKKVADRTRSLIHGDLGSYADFKVASQKLQSISDPLLGERIKRLGSRALDVQWVPADNAKAAEKSFFKINEVATPLDKTEIKILKARTSPSAIASRAIINRGVGHEYWKEFKDTVRTDIQQLAKNLYDSLFLPPLSEPHKSADMPVGGHGYNTLPFVFDLVNSTNHVTVFDAAKLDETAISALADKDGAQTVQYLKNVEKLMERITGPSSVSIGPHPAVYFYTRGGAFQPSAFLATAEFLTWLEKNNELIAFCGVRKNFETFLIEHKEFLSRTVHKFGAGVRSVTPMVELLRKIFACQKGGMNVPETVESLRTDPKFSYVFAGIQIEAKSGQFGRNTKSAAFLKALFENPIRCSICGGMLHGKSISIDHVTDKKDGGLATTANAAVAHGYCNSTYKYKRIAA
ncbi:MAG TPA: DUF262 domain-containing protein [Stellaceae bacterium]|nr:DUF262 domain-containing protein [Stellaceae bacterium]